MGHKGIEFRFFREVVEAIAADRLVLPTLPAVALRVSAACRRPGVRAAGLAQEIAADPALAVRLMRVANSAAQRTPRAAATLQQAVTRLGLELTRALVSAMAMQQLYVARAPLLRQRLARSWANSIEVASWSRALAPAAGIDPDAALLAGLIHEVGVLPIVRMAESHDDLLAEPDALEEVIFRLHPRVGRRLLEAWDLPGLAAIPQDCMDFGRQHAGATDLADVVTCALLQPRHHADAWLAGIDRQRVPALARLHPPPDVAPAVEEGLRLLNAA